MDGVFLGREVVARWRPWQILDGSKRSACQMTELHRQPPLLLLLEYSHRDTTLRGDLEIPNATMNVCLGRCSVCMERRMS